MLCKQPLILYIQLEKKTKKPLLLRLYLFFHDFVISFGRANTQAGSLLKIKRREVYGSSFVLAGDLLNEE